MGFFSILLKGFKDNSFKKMFFLFCYVFFCKYLPNSNSFLFGKVARSLRYQCCKRIFLFCGKNVNIERGANFGSGFKLQIGDNSGLGINCKVPSNLVVGCNVMMGPHCYILGANHLFVDRETPMIEQGFSEKKQTSIENDVWIGRDVLFTPGRYVKTGTIVGARCVLTKDFPEYSVIGGNPSRLIKSR